jgi:hypothetical protein
MELTHRWPLVDIDRQPRIDGVLIDGGAVDDTGDGDVLLAVGIRSWADSGHQQGAAEQLAARATRDKPLRKEYPQYGHQQEQKTEFPHAAMVAAMFGRTDLRPYCPTRIRRSVDVKEKCAKGR